jgi:hypothetical protein
MKRVPIFDLQEGLDEAQYRGEEVSEAFRAMAELMDYEDA